MTIMLTLGEQQELRQIEQELRDADRGFGWRLTMLQGMLRWARPGRQAYLLVLAMLVAALLRLIAAAGRLLIAVAEGAMLMEPGRPDGSWRHGLARLWGPGGRLVGTSTAQDRPRSEGTDLP